MLKAKLEKQENPTVVFTDVDGTLFSPNLNIITAPIFNSQTAAVLSMRNIPFIVVTGRSFWRKIDQFHLTLLGLPKPDAVITANGTIIYIRQKENYISDFTWQGIMQSTKITDEKGKITSWNKWDITTEIEAYLIQNNFYYKVVRGNTYLIRIRLNKYKIKTIEQIEKDIKQIFPKGLKIILTEKLLWENTEQIFSGEMLITPNTAGKDKAVAYLLKTLSIEIQKPIHAMLFGDASVDVPMLCMKENKTYFTLSQFAVHPTPFAKKVLQQHLAKQPNLHILPGDGPKEILLTLKPTLRKQQNIALEKIRGEEQNFRSDSSELQSQENFRSDQSSPNEKMFSPAQNNKARLIIRIFEKLLDNLVDKNLSPNEVSFLGLKKLSLGLSLLHKKNSSLVNKTKGLYHYSFGNLTDILDGIRARQNQESRIKNQEHTLPGQLVDGFADRTKEFIQLYERAKQRFVIARSKTTIQSQQFDNVAMKQCVDTFLSAISCALPSIARAQVEITGKTVSERDEKGGSMIDRTKKLFFSLLMDTIGVHKRSFEIDQQIYSSNIATFQHRLSSLRGTKQSPKNVIPNERDESQLSDFQKKALERFLLYVDVLQQENTIIKKFLAKYPKLLRESEKQAVKLAEDYLKLPINKLRKKFGVKDYKLQVKDYL